MTSVFDLRVEIIRQEYDRADGAIRAYDDHLFKIKGWAITACSAITVFGIDNGRVAIYLVGIAAALGFWVLDAYTKTIQRRFIDRVAAIERFLHGADLDRAAERQSLDAIALPPIRELFKAGHRSPLLRLLREAGHFNTFFLYLALIALMSMLLIAEIAR